MSPIGDRFCVASTVSQGCNCTQYSRYANHMETNGITADYGLFTSGDAPKSQNPGDCMAHPHFDCLQRIAALSDFASYTQEWKPECNMVEESRGNYPYLKMEDAK